MSTPDACEMQKRWMKQLEDLHHMWKHSGMPAPADHACPATCRTAPKSKDPMNKGRLLVGTHVTPGKRQAGIVAKAAEFLVQLGFQDGVGHNQGVQSVRQVHDAVAAMTATIQEAYRDGHQWISVRKYDFVAFFQEVQRSSVLQSARYWKEMTESRYGGRNVVRVDTGARQLYGNVHPRATRWRKGAGYVTDNPACELVRSGGTTTDGTYKIPMRAIEQYLEVDSDVLIEIGQRLGRQQRGLTIGSCWGGTGTTLWAAHREVLHQTQSIRQRRKEQCVWCAHRNVHTYGTIAHGSQNARMHMMRWVDDRWGVIAGCCIPAIRRQSRMEYLRFTAATYEVKELLADIWPANVAYDQEDAAWETTITKILAFIGTYIQQTREDVTSVVGMDVGIAHDNGPVQQLPAWGAVMRSSANAKLVTRPNTKDRQLLDKEGMIRQDELRQPRFPPAKLTYDAATVRRTLAGTMVRFADMTQPRWEGMDDPREEILQWWSEPWGALRREMLIQGWPARMWTEAARIVGWSSNAWTAPHQRHRARVVSELAVRALHPRFGQGTRKGQEGTGEPPGRTGEAIDVGLTRMDGHDDETDGSNRGRKGGKGGKGQEQQGGQGDNRPPDGAQTELGKGATDSRPQDKNHGNHEHQDNKGERENKTEEDQHRTKGRGKGGSDKKGYGKGQQAMTRESVRVGDPKRQVRSEQRQRGREKEREREQGKVQQGEREKGAGSAEGRPEKEKRELDHTGGRMAGKGERKADRMDRRIARDKNWRNKGAGRSEI